MITYKRSQLPKTPIRVADKQRIVAIHDFLAALHEGRTPDQNLLNIVSEIFEEVLAGKDANQAFGFDSIPTIGRPAHSGFTPSDRVAAFIELEIRRLGDGRGSLQKAMLTAQESFVENLDLRLIRRDWAQSQLTVKPLSTDDLIMIIEPYKIGQ